MNQKKADRILKTRGYFLLVSLVLLIVAGAWFTHYRGHIADTKMKNRVLTEAVELAHSLNLHYVKSLTFTPGDKDLPAYRRICEQMRAYSKLIHQRGIYSMKLIGGSIYFGPESYAESDPYASPPGTLYEEPSETDFEALRNGSTAVFGPITDEYGSFISALAPVIDPSTGEVLMVVGIDIPAEFHQKIIRNSRYLPVTLTALLLIILLAGFVLINKRLYFSPERKAKYRYLEALLVFAAGIIVTIALTILSNEAEKSEKEQIFSSKSYAVTDILRNALQGIVQDMQAIQMYITHSNLVTAREFHEFVRNLTITSTAEAYLWAPVDEVSQNVQSGNVQVFLEPGFIVPQSGMKFFTSGNLLSDSSLKKAILLSINTMLVTPVDSFPWDMPEGSGNYILALQSVFKPKLRPGSIYGDTVKGVLFTVVDLQKTLENSITSSGQYKQYFETGIYDMTEQQPHLAASFSMLPADKNAQLFSLPSEDNGYISRLVPLFLFGKTFVVLTRSTPAFHRAFPVVNGTFSLITGLFITIILAMFVSFQRNRQYFLEQSVDQRTQELNERVKELTCLNRINSEMRSVQNPDMLFRNIAGHLKQGMIFPELVVPEIEIENRKYVPDGDDTTGKTGKVIEEISMFGQNKGKITLYQSGKLSLLDEEHNMIKHVAHLLSRWLEKSEAENISKQRESEMNAFMDASTESILLIDTEGTIITANSEFSRVFRQPLSKLTGSNIFNVLPEKHREISLARVDEMLLTRSPVRYEIEHNNRIYYISLSPVKNHEYKIVNIAVFGIDITERKNIETELKKAMQKMEASDHLKTAFLNNISHEVRTPLNGILGFADIITQPGLSQHEIDQCLDILHVSSKRLTDTINDYMDMSLIVSGNLQPIHQPFFLSKTMMDIFDNFETFSKAKNLELKLGIPEKDTNFVFNQDEEMIKKVISQLVDNAIKFSTKGTIRFGFKIEGNLVCFHVEDEGIGISPEAINRIFENFVQEDISRTRQHEGSGLGLSIARGLVTLLGGDISVDSAKGAGSSFKIRIPVDASDKSISGSHQPSEKVASDKHPLVLVAEDDESSYLYLENVFTRRNIKLLRAKNGIQAVELSKSNPDIQLILMDLKMPEMDGFEATRQIKSFRPDVPVIAITAFAMSGDERKAMEAGCDDYLPKPLKLVTLMKKLENYGIPQA